MGILTFGLALVVFLAGCVAPVQGRRLPRRSLQVKPPPLRGRPGWLALVLTILVVVLLMALVIATVFFSVTKLATELPAYMAEMAATPSGEPSTVATAIAALVASAQSTTSGLGPIAQGLLSTTLELLAQFGMALFIFFFMITLR